MRLQERVGLICLEQGLSSWVRWLPPRVLSAVGWWRRKKGFYDKLTLHIFHVSWRRSRSLSSLVAYLLFRRDMGYPLKTRWARVLIENMEMFGARHRRLVLALLAESNRANLDLVPIPYVVESAGRMAPLASHLETMEIGKGHPWLAPLDRMQERWREDFKEFFSQRRSGGICIVGNSGSLSGAGLGNQIDSHALVVRFNCYRSSKTLVADIGSQIDVWVGAPDFSGTPPEGVPWAIVSGPDVRFRKQKWESMKSRLAAERPVLTVPLAIWRDLVARTEAPPSAGVLFLAWLKEFLGSWEGVSIAGFCASTRETPYHHAESKRQPSPRHNWNKEKELLRLWQSQGLVSLGSSPGLENHEQQAA
jgi:Glycosyltransferase family 29 (sialyltransferase)